MLDKQCVDIRLPDNEIVNFGNCGHDFVITLVIGMSGLYICVWLTTM